MRARSSAFHLAARWAKIRFDDTHGLVSGEVQGLFRLKDAPRAIAVGASAGVFFGFIPLWGLKTLLAIASARLLRGNLIAAAITVTLHDVLLPLMPLLLRW